MALSPTLPECAVSERPYLPTPTGGCGTFLALHAGGRLSAGRARAATGVATGVAIGTPSPCVESGLRGVPICICRAARRPSLHDEGFGQASVEGLALHLLSVSGFGFGFGLGPR